MDTKKRASDSEKVAAYMQALEHPFKTGIERLRTIIKDVDARIEERIKWNAPSYHVAGVDFLTFHVKSTNRVHLIFHHPAIVQIDSPLLEGAYKDRRMVYFTDNAAVERDGKELGRIIREQVDFLQP